MNNTQKTRFVLILLCVVVGLGYLLMNKTKEAWKTDNKNSLVYSNSKYSFSLKYPDTYKAITSQSVSDQTVLTNEFMLLTTNKNREVVPDEGCNGTYFLSVSSGEGVKFSDFGNKKHYDYLDQVTIQSMRVGNYQAYYAKGIVNDKAVYAQEGFKSLSFTLKKGNNLISLTTCDSENADQPRSVNEAEFKQIVSSINDI